MPVFSFMSLLQRAQSDAQRFISDLNGFAVQVHFTAPDGTEATVAGVFSNHNVGVSEQNVPVNSQKASVTVSEQTLVDAEYPVRKNGVVALEAHKVSYKDSTGVLKNYRVAEVFSDRTVGNVVLILQRSD